MASIPDFADIVREHQKMVYSIAFHALRDRAAAEDVTQDVFLALFENLGKLESSKHVKAWLARVASRRAIDEIRRRRYRKGPSLEDVAEPSAAGNHQDFLLEKRLQEMVARLPAAARLMIILRYQEDMELSQIAGALDIPLQTVKSRLHRSVHLLREKMRRHAPVALRGTDS